MLPTRDPSQDRRPTQTESEELETKFPANGQEKKKAGVAILISDKIDFKRRARNRDPEVTLYSKEESTRKTYTL